jgi:superfamily II DNA or RNA helicase
MNKREQIQTECTTTILDCKFNGVINVSPRLGKTKCVIDALNKVPIKQNLVLNILIIAPKLPILDSWKQEVVLWGMRDNVNITYVWSNSLKKLKHTKHSYHLIIADECHDYNDKVIAELRHHQYFNGSKILCLTGTLDDNSKINLKKVLNLDVIYSYSFEQAIEDNIIADYEITCIGCELDNVEKVILAGSKDKPFYQTEQQAYTYWNNRYNEAVEKKNFASLQYLMSKRTNLIYNSLSKLKVTKKIVSEVDRCIIFTGRQEIADIIGDNSYHSKSTTNTLEQFINGDFNKLSVISKISMGITVPNLKTVIFNQLKSVETLAIQQAMRSMNIEKGKKAKIYVVYLKNTQDEVWMKKALNGFEQSKIINL